MGYLEPYVKEVDIYWEVDPIEEFSWSEIILWMFAILWFCMLLISLNSAGARILLLTIPTSFIPFDIRKRLPFTHLVYSSTFGSKPDSSTIFNILGLLLITLLQLIIIFLAIGIFLLLKYLVIIWIGKGPANKLLSHLRWSVTEISGTQQPLAKITFSFKVIWFPFLSIINKFAGYKSELMKDLNNYRNYFNSLNCFSNGKIPVNITRVQN